MGQTNVHKSVTIWGRDFVLYLSWIMARPFVACHKFDLVFKVTKITESFCIWKFWRWHYMSSLGLEDVYHDWRCIYWKTTSHSSTRLVWPMSRSQQQWTFATEVNGMQLKIHNIIMSSQLSSPKIDLQLPVVMFYFLFKYQISVTSLLVFMDQSSIFNCNKFHCKHLVFILVVI